MLVIEELFDKINLEVAPYFQRDFWHGEEIIEVIKLQVEYIFYGVV